MNNYNLKEIISDLTDSFEEIQKVFLFGSRAHKTNSLRSDIDFIIISEDTIPAVNLYEWIDANYKVVDIFKTTDNKTAESAANGSVISSDNVLTEQVQAIELWDKSNSFNDSFEDWIQSLRDGVEIEPTYAKVSYDMYKAISDFKKIVADNDFPNTNLGFNWEVIGQSLSKKIENSIEFLSGWTGTSGSFNKVKLSNERDFQNLCELVLKPWLPSTQREVAVAKFDGQSKNIDFSIKSNRILIEAKHIKDSNTEAKAIKEIEGITKFYLSNTNVKLLLFWVLIEKNYDYDKSLLEDSFSNSNNDTVVITRIFTNNLA